MIDLATPDLTEHDGHLIHRVAVATADGGRELRFAVPVEFGRLVSDRAESALIALLLPAMRLGDDIRVHGPVSPRLVQNLAGPFQEMLVQMLPDLQRVSIHADYQIESEEGGSGVATGFSLGVDSFTVLRDHFIAPSSPSPKLTHLTYLNVGSHFHGGRDVFLKRFPRAQEVASRFGLPLVPIDSNIDEFYPDLTYQQTMTMRNIAAAYVLQRGLGHYIVAAGQFREDQRIGPTESMPSADDFTLPLLASETMKTTPGGSQYRRTEKIRIVSRIPESTDSLHVCNEIDWDPTQNCSWCQKCMRTMLTLDILGELDRYSPSFNLERYQKRRNEFIAKVYFEGGVYNPEVIALIAETGWELPLGARLRIASRAMYFKRIARRLRKRIASLSLISSPSTTGSSP